MVLSADKIVCGAVGRAGCEPGPSAPGWSGVVADVDRTLSTKAMDDANDAAPAALSYGQEPGREARSAGTGSLRAGAMRFVVLISCPDKGWQKL